VDLKLMVFDVAGTTVCDDDNAVAGRVCDAFQAAGIDVALAEVNPVMGMPKPLAVRELLRQKRGVADEVSADAIHADFQRRIIAHYRTAPGVRAAPGAEEFFARLRDRGIRVTLDTGFDRPTLNAILDRLGWHDVIDDSVTSDEVANGRPAPDMIHVLMQRAGVSDPEAVGKVGDSISDIEQGINARCGLVAAVMGERTRTSVADYPGVIAIDKLEELAPYVDGVATGQAG
jgi:phosphonatase-like hydrolase